ncbi:MAG: hypothetical protein MUF54_17165 [Polyangiaceae bacterium]|jgi:hypothetical protein|nr:hypothetical protein [Polyangiaceae bacterium]
MLTAPQLGQSAQPLHPDDLHLLRADAARSAARLRARLHKGVPLAETTLTATSNAHEEASRMLAMRDYLLSMAVKYHGLAKHWQQVAGQQRGVDDDPTIPEIEEGDLRVGQCDLLQLSDGTWGIGWDEDSDHAGMNYPASGTAARRPDAQAIPLIRPRCAKPQRET